MSKLVVNCITGGVEEVSFTSEEIEQRKQELELDIQRLDSLVPPKEEIDQAEFELRTINLLIELGVI